MDERLRFVAKLLDGEAMSGLCREFGISRKTGYKIFNRYKESGFEALSDRYRALRRCSGQRFMVRRLQGRVQARQRPVLLSPHRHRPRFPLPAPVRSARVNARRHCDHRLRATIPRARPAVSHPLRQRRTVRQSQCAVQPVQAFRLVAASGHCDRAHQARPSTAKRTS